MIQLTLRMTRFYKVLLLFTVIFILPSCVETERDISSVIQDHFLPYPNEIATIEKGVAPNTMAGQAMKLYEEKRYDQAIILFNELIQIEGTTEKRYSWIFYKANAELAQGQYQNALKTFSYLPSGHILFEESQWYIGLISLQQGQITQAKNAFQQINNTHSKYQEAKKIIRDFNL